MSGRVTYQTRRVPGGHVAIVRFHTGGPGADTVGASGKSAREALARAAVLANQIASSEVFQAVAPPGTAAAIKAIAALSKAPDPVQLLGKYAGPGARRLARKLKFW